MKQVWVVALFLSTFLYGQGGYLKEQWDDAREEARLRAQRAIGEMIYGYYVQYRSVVSIRENRSVMETQFGAIAMPMVKFSRFVGYRELGLLRVKATIAKTAFIEAINTEKKSRTGKELTKQEYQDLRFMFPETISAHGFGACTKNPRSPGRHYIDTIEAYKVEASVRMVNYLKGPTLSAVSQLNNFFLTQDTIEAFLPKTLLRNAIFSVSEPNKQNQRDISVTLMITGSDWIFSVSAALEKQGQKLSNEEYLKLKNRFARYPDRYITFRLPDDLLIDPNTSDLGISSSVGGFGTTEPPLGFNELGEENILWK